MAKRLMAHSTHLTIGMFLIILGILMYAKQVGWIAPDFPVWSVVLIALGIVMVAGEMSK